jgi:YHS domain-containing protein
MIKIIITLSFLIPLFNHLSSQSTPTLTIVRTNQFNLEKSSLAIQGYDPVSYFLTKPVEGNAAIAYKYNGVTYHFNSQQNLDLFKKVPSKFEPQYGGWCAYAMGAKGEKVEIDPQTYKIVNGKLYLFYNSTFNNTLPKWNKDELNLNKKADANWFKFYK